MKILITGNLGYVGPGVTRQLRARYPEATLIGVDMGYFAHCLTDARPAPETLLDAQCFADIRHTFRRLGYRNSTRSCIWRPSRTMP